MSCLYKNVVTECNQLNDVDILGGNLQEDQLDINHDDIEFMIDSKYETEEEFNLKHATFTDTKLGNFLSYI